MKVLICDDSKYLRLTIKTIVEQLGHTVVGEAANGEDAVQLYSKLHPDIVTMDVVMPRMNGLQALMKIMELDPNAQVLIVTALSHEPLIKKALKMGAVGFVTKPFTSAEFIQGFNAVI